MDPSSDSPIDSILAQRVVFPDGILKTGPFLIKIERDGSFGSITGPLEAPPPSVPNQVRCDLVTPGFIDIHTHGLGGAKDVIEFWLNPSHSCFILPRYGTTSVLATITFPKDNPALIKSTIDSIISWIKNPLPKAARIEGIHGEGPIVADYGGLVESDREMELEKFSAFVDSFQNTLKVMTIAPHVDAKIQYGRMKKLQASGVRVALGHDKQATEEEIVGALQLSAHDHNSMHFTHVFNVQGFNHRTPGLANFALLSSFPKLPQFEGIVEPTIELIGDRAHLHDIIVQMTLCCKKPSKIAFVTDTILSADNADNEAIYGGRCVAIANSEQGRPRVVLKGGNVLAGSCSTLLQTFHDLVHIFGVPIGHAVQMVSQTPAEIAKLSHVGVIKTGARADFLVFDADLQLQSTFIAGIQSYKRS